MSINSMSSTSITKTTPPSDNYGYNSTNKGSIDLKTGNVERYAQKMSNTMMKIKKDNYNGNINQNGFINPPELIFPQNNSGYNIASNQQIQQAANPPQIHNTYYNPSTGLYRQTFQ